MDKSGNVTSGQVNFDIFPDPMSGVFYDGDSEISVHLAPSIDYLIIV